MNDYIVVYYDGNYKNEIIVSATTRFIAGMIFESIAENSDIKYDWYEVKTPSATFTSVSGERYNLD